jgi:hypothetical protein
MSWLNWGQFRLSPNYGSKYHFSVNQTPDLEHEITDPYLIERTKAAFIKDKNHD